MNAPSDVQDLRYLEPERVMVAGDDCTGMTVRDAHGRRLGRLDGFVVDPPARRLRYFVVKPSGWKAATRLVPITAARVNVDDRAIDMIDESADTGEPVPNVEYPSFSDDDLLAAIFRSGAR